MDGLLLWNHWLVVAWIAPAAWALAAIIDVLLIEQRTYRNATQAAAISGMVVGLPILSVALPATELTGLEVDTALLAAAGGLCNILMLLFYYKAMFIANDAAHTETFLNLEVLVIPLLAFVFLGDQLSTANYAGVGLAAVGVLILNNPRWRYLVGRARLTAFLFAAVLASSASLVIEDAVFTQTSFWNGLACYGFGVLFGALLLAQRCGPHNVVITFARHKKAILTAELFTLIATSAGLRAIDLSPSVSLVAVIESTRPVLIMIACLGCWMLLRRIRSCSSDVTHALREQFDTAPTKLVANGFIIAGVYVVSMVATSG